MEGIIYYLFEYGLYLLAFYLLFLLLFRGRNDHQFNRFYLTSSSIICLIIPLLPKGIMSEQKSVFGALLEPVEIGAQGTAQLISNANESLPIIATLGIIYVSITLIFALRFLAGLFKIQSYIENGIKKIYKNNFIIESAQVSAPFSFFNHIFLPKSNYSQEEIDLIIEHEMTHIQYGHSLEKLFFLINKIFFWWNPISHRYFRELELIHEYQVDEKLCALSSKKTYSNFLLSQINTQSQYTFVNNISSHIKNRIIMISSKNKSNPRIIKWGSYLCLFFALVFLHSCSKEEEPSIEDNYREYKVLEEVTTEDGDFFRIERIDTMTIFDYDTKEETTEIVRSVVQVYKTPEVMPVFGDCSNISDVEEKYACSNEALLKFIYSNLTYPKEAKDNGVQGMNVVQFVITENGKLQNIEFVKSIEHGTNDAILHVLEKMDEKNEWTAGRHHGKNVATQFTLPVKFKLEG